MADYKTKILRKEIDVDIPYKDEEGHDSIKTVHIAFTSTRMVRAYGAMMKKVADIIGIYHEINNVKDEIGSAIVDKELFSYGEDGSISIKKVSLLERRRMHKELQKRYKELEDKLYAYDESFFDEKFNLIHMILVRNGVTDSDLLSRDWWMDSVDSHDVMAFIETVCTKDDELIDPKKKEWAKK